MNFGDSQIIITKIGNGYLVQIPVEFERSIGGMPVSDYKDLMLGIGSEIQAVKEPLLRQHESTNQTQEEPKASLKTVLNAEIGQLYFPSLPEACKFIAENIF